MSPEYSTSAAPVNGGEGSGADIEKHSPNGKDAERLVESPVHMNEQEEDDQQRMETREDEKRRAHEDIQEDDSTVRDESDDDDEDDDDDDEPSLKYQRITGAIPDLLKKDSASALAISNKKMVIRFVFFCAGHDVHYLSSRQWEHMPVSFTFLI
jgi:hypothetical protein